LITARYRQQGDFNKNTLNIIKATNTRRLKGFEMDIYRKMMRISWAEHKANNLLLKKLQPTRRFLAEIKIKKVAILWPCSKSGQFIYTCAAWHQRWE